MRLTRRQMLRAAASAGAAVLLGGRSAAERALGAVGRTYAAMGWIGLTMTGIAFEAVPLAGVWLLVALWLGRKQTVIARANVPEGITR